MKPSERINEIARDRKLLYPDAIIEYLDEQYENEQKELEAYAAAHPNGPPSLEDILAEPSRWIPIVATSPSGKSQWVCRCCGRVSVTPDKTCPKDALVVMGGRSMFTQCDVWEKGLVR